MTLSETNPGIHPDPNTSNDVNTSHDTNGVDTDFNFIMVDKGAETGLLGKETLEQFMEKAAASPRLVRTSHARIADMLDERDVFSGIIGQENAIAETKAYFSSARSGSALRKRILVYVGPTGSGKSSIAIALKEGLKDYSKTDDGGVYAIEGCPVQETPLHAIPHEERPAAAAKVDLPAIEGNPCACCQKKIDVLGGDISSLPVEQIHLSEGRGIASVKPGAVGDTPEITLFATNEATAIDWKKVYASPPHQANGGILELVDAGELEEKFLMSLMSVAQEQEVSLPGYGSVHVDEAIIGHTNEPKFLAILQRNPALKDRVFIINVPYSVKMNDEKEIYEKELANSNNVHIAPMAIEMAAMFAIATRVMEPKDKSITLIDKIRLLNGEQVDGYTEKTTQDLRDEEEAQRDGMSGISTRFMVNALTRALDRNDGHCVNALTALSAIQEEIHAELTFDKNTKDTYTKLVNRVRTEFNNTITTEVQSAFIEDFPGKAKKMFNDYYDNAEAYVLDKKLLDPITEDEVAPDEQFMRKVEEKIGISENAKKAFREEVFTRIASLVRQATREGKPPEAIQKEVFTYTAHPKLRQAIEKVLLKDVFEVAQAVTSTKTPDKEQIAKIDIAKNALKEKDYCDGCATDMLKYAGPLLTAA